jgi:hypothetical protein
MLLIIRRAAHRQMARANYWEQTDAIFKESIGQRCVLARTNSSSFPISRRAAQALKYELLKKSRRSR